jgi:hypothetical protein
MTLLALFMCGEAFLRWSGDRLSADIVHIRQIPRIAAELQEEKGARVLFLGNSLLREGLRLEDFRKAFASDCGADVRFAEVYPDDTTILDWYYLFKRYFDGGNAPQYLAVSFALQQMTDANTIHSDRIAAYFGGWSNAREVLSVDLPTLGERVDYMLSSSFRMWAEKERVRTRVLSVLTPSYRATARRLNEVARYRSGPGGGPAEYSRLRRFLSLCESRGVQLLAIAMPQPFTYTIDQGLGAVLAQHGCRLVDMRSTRGLSRRDFSDGYHLDPGGAAVYSEALGHRLAAELASCGAGSATAASASSVGTDPSDSTRRPPSLEHDGPPPH